MPDDATAQLLCHRCGAILTPGEGSFFVVKIEAFADPSPPNLSGLSEGDLLREIDDLIDAVNEMSEQELMDEVYRRMTLLLCGRCYRQWIKAPAG